MLRAWAAVWLRKPGWLAPGGTAWLVKLHPIQRDERERRKCHLLWVLCFEQEHVPKININRVCQERACMWRSRPWRSQIASLDTDAFSGFWRVNNFTFVIGGLFPNRNRTKSHVCYYIYWSLSPLFFFLQIKQMQCWSFLDINKRGLMWEGKCPAQPHGSLYAFVTRQLPSTKSVWCVWLCNWLCQCESSAGKHCVVVILYPASCVLVRQHKTCLFWLSRP